MPPSPADRKRAAHLRTELHRHNELYYTGGQTELSDQDFDALLRELQDLETRHPDLITPDSPTRRVGGAPIEHFVTVAHAVPMLSIDNTYNQDELRTWYDRTAKALGFFKETKDGPASLFAAASPKSTEPPPGPPLRTEPKVDGVALSLTYENGELIRAVTRGDGRKGDDITHNIRTVAAVPTKVSGASVPQTLEVRGEIFMPDAVFATLNERRRAADEEPYANPRNCTAGTLKQKDPNKVHGGLRFYAHNLGVWEPGPDGPAKPTTQADFFAAADALGLPTNPDAADAATFDDAWARVEAFNEKRHVLDHATDGMVIKIDDFAAHAQLGANSKSPRWCIAYKYAAERAATVLEAVEWQVGKTGKLTPRAKMTPVLLAGTTITHASLHNFGEVLRKDIHLNDTVEIEKAGEIIPQVVRVLPNKRPADAPPIAAPDQCPACNTPVEIEQDVRRINEHAVYARKLERESEKARKEARQPRDPDTFGPPPAALGPLDETARYCPNPACPAQLRERLTHFVGRNQMDIDALGEKTVHQLVDAGLLTNLGDIFRLHRHKEAILELERMGEKKAENLIAGVEAAKSRGLRRVLAGLTIGHVGAGGARRLTQAFPDIDQLMAADEETLADLEDVGPITAASVRHFLDSDVGQATIDDLRREGVDLTETVIAPPPPPPTRPSTARRSSSPAPSNTGAATTSRRTLKPWAPRSRAASAKTPTSSSPAKKPAASSPKPSPSASRCGTSNAFRPSFRRRVPGATAFRPCPISRLTPPPQSVRLVPAPDRRVAPASVSPRVRVPGGSRARALHLHVNRNRRPGSRPPLPPQPRQRRLRRPAAAFVQLFGQSPAPARRPALSRNPRLLALHAQRLVRDYPRTRAARRRHSRIPRLARQPAR